MATSITHRIDGRTWDGPAQRHGDVYDPATGQNHQDRRLRVRRRRQRGGRVGARRV